MVGSMLLAFFLLSATPVRGHRLAVDVEEHELAAFEKHEVASTWGRSCDSIQNRFQQQQSGMADIEPDSMRSVFASISLLRTIRRANARNCSFIQDPNVDTSGASHLAAASLRRSPCYEAANEAVRAAQELPEEERDDAVASAMVMMLSSTCTAESGEAPELSSPSEEEIEEGIDEATDQILDDLSVEPESSLLQTNNGFVIATDVTFIIGWILFGLAIAVLCGYLMQFIWNSLKWLRCAMTHSGEVSACYDAEAPTWLRYLLTGGSAALCVAGGAYTGWIPSFITTVMLGDALPIFEAVNFRR